MGQIDGRPDPDEEESSEPGQAKAATKRAQNPLVKTLLTGASFQSTWRGNGLPIPGSETDRSPQPDGSGVHQLASQVVGEAAALSAAMSPEKTESAPHGTYPPPAMVSETDRRAEKPEDPRQLGLADTQQQTRRDPPQAGASTGGGRRASRRGSFNPKLGRTLRMEIAIGSNPPPDRGPSPSSASPSKAASGAPPPAEVVDAHVVSAKTQRIGARRDSDMSYREPGRSTDPFGSAGFKTWNNPPGPGPRPASSLPPPLPRGHHSAFPSLAEQQANSSTLSDGGLPWQAPRRRVRAGDRTVITSRGRGDSVSKRDYLLVGLLVCAVGVTAGMFLTNTNEPSETVHEPEPEIENGVSSATQGQGQGEPQPAADVANVTEIVSNPPNAEVVFGGAVIGNTPVRVARANFDADYLVRIAGFHPQLVRVGQTSPATIVVSLNRDAAAATVGFDPGAPVNAARANPSAPSDPIPGAAPSPAPSATIPSLSTSGPGAANPGTPSSPAPLR